LQCRDCFDTSQIMVDGIACNAMVCVVCAAGTRGGTCPCCQEHVWNELGQSQLALRRAALLRRDTKVRCARRLLASIREL
jgi:hypothetical protein